MALLRARGINLEEINNPEAQQILTHIATSPLPTYYPPEYYSIYKNTNSNEEVVSEDESKSKRLKTEWTKHFDDETGAAYYYNEITGESSWGEENK